MIRVSLLMVNEDDNEDDYVTVCTIIMSFESLDDDNDHREWHTLFGWGASSSIYETSCFSQFLQFYPFRKPILSITWYQRN